MMPIILAAAKRRNAGAPYELPASAPWNAPTYLPSFSTPHGTGIAVHPDVIDFGPGNTWNGYRYWMAMTPLYTENGATDPENPCILAAHDPYHWRVPAGLTNPIAPTPPNGYNSDTALAFDAGVLYCYWRERPSNGDEIIWVSSSTNGATWSPRNMVAHWTGSGNQHTSPTIIRHGTGWRVYLCLQALRKIEYVDIAALDDTWGPTTVLPDLPGDGPAHIAITKAGSTWYMAGHTPATGAAIKAWTSTDLTTWTPAKTILTPGGWDSPRLYRCALAPHEDGERMRVWYSGGGYAAGGAGKGDRIAYTEIPLSAFA